MNLSQKIPDYLPKMSGFLGFVMINKDINPECHGNFQRRLSEIRCWHQDDIIVMRTIYSPIISGEANILI
jgi:hypothetical protein